MHRTLRRPALAVLAALLPLAAAAAPPPAKKPKVAIIDPHVAGGVEPSAAEGLAALLASEVARRPALSVVSSADVRALLGFEQQKAAVGCTGGPCATELAGALGATWLLSVEVTRVGSSWILGLALLDAARPAAVSRVTRRAGSLDGLVDAVPGAVDELLEPLGAVAAVAKGSRFDGAWEAIVDCPATGAAKTVKAYTLRIPVEVKDGHLTAAHLGDQEAGMLRLEGTIAPDGQARLNANGLTGKTDYSLQRSTPGTPYAYGVEATFEARRGAGKRLEGRPCTFTFTRR